MTSSRPSELTVLFFAALLCFSNAAAEARSFEELEQSFKQKKDRIEEEVESGRLPSEAGKEARELWISLQQSLIDNSARIEKLKLRIREYSGDHQDEALEQLVRVSEERVLILLSHMEKINSIAPAGLAGQASGNVSDESGAEELKMKKEESSAPEINIRFEAEDLIKGEQSLE